MHLENVARWGTYLESEALQISLGGEAPFTWSLPKRMRGKEKETVGSRVAPPSILTKEKIRSRARSAPLKRSLGDRRLMSRGIYLARWLFVGRTSSGFREREERRS